MTFGYEKSSVKSSSFGGVHSNARLLATTNKTYGKDVTDEEVRELPESVDWR